MNQKRILKSIISLLLLFSTQLEAQNDSIAIDSVKIKEKFGIRLGVDISRPIIQTIQKQDLGFEITADYRLTKDIYIASEFGYASEPGEEDFITFHTKGSYMKVGGNYNLYENYKGFNNEIYAGLRYGFSTFQQHLISYTTPDLDNYFGYQTFYPDEVTERLTAHWIELNFGLKVEVMKNLFLSAGIQAKKLISSTQPDNFSNLYIPGFNSVLIGNKGIGFNYTISYLVPFYKK